MCRTREKAQRRTRNQKHSILYWPKPAERDVRSVLEAETAVVEAHLLWVQKEKEERDQPNFARRSETDAPVAPLSLSSNKEKAAERREEKGKENHTDEYQCSPRRIRALMFLLETTYLHTQINQ